MLRRIHILIIFVLASTLSTLAVAAKPTGVGSTEVGAADVLTVLECNFRKGHDKNFDLWPDHWTRVAGVRFPQFIKAEIELVPPNESPAGEEIAALTVTLNGGEFAAYSPPVEASNHYNYQVDVLVQTIGVTGDHPRVMLDFLDKKQHLVRRIASEPVGNTEGKWTKVSIGPVSPGTEPIAWVRVRLATQPGKQADLSGKIRFADVWLGRLARLDLTMDKTTDASEFGIFKLGQEISIDCTVSGFKSERPTVQFLLKDMDGQVVQSADLRLKVAETDDPLHRLGSVQWHPEPPKAGFYRVYASLENEELKRCRGETSLAIVESFGWNTDSEFGWSLPGGRGQYTIEQLATLLLRLGNGWVEYPFWYGESTSEKEIELMLRFIDRLSMSGVKMVGLLCDPPPEVRRHFGDPPSLSAAEVFTADPELWYPSLEPVLLRLGPRVPYWLLGSQEDDSFINQSELQERLAEIMQTLDRTRVDVALGVPWRWFVAETSWDGTKRGVPAFLSLTADPPLTAQELKEYARVAFAPTGEGTEPFSSTQDDATTQNTTSSRRKTESRDAVRVPYRAVLNVLSEKDYSPKVRAADLVQRMLAAKQGGASAVLLNNPFDKESGMIRENGTADILLLPWRTTALTFGGSQYMGSMELPNGSENRLFSRGTEVMMAVWNDRPCEERLYLGDEVRIVDIWGHTYAPKTDGDKQIIPVGSTPVFVTGLNPMVAQIQMNVHFEKDTLPAVLNRDYENKLVFKNVFPGGIVGKIYLNMPKEWDVNPKRIFLQLVQNESLEQPLNITVPFAALAGKNQVRLDFEIGNRKQFRFSVYRTIQIGSDDIQMDFFPLFDEKGNLTIIQRFVNQTDRPVNFRCQLAVPGRQWTEAQIIGSGRGAFEAKHEFPDAKDLIGQTVRARVTETNGLQTLNYSFVIE